MVWAMRLRGIAAVGIMATLALGACSSSPAATGADPGPSGPTVIPSESITTSASPEPTTSAPASAEPDRAAVIKDLLEQTQELQRTGSDCVDAAVPSVCGVQLVRSTQRLIDTVIEKAVKIGPEATILLDTIEKRGITNNIGGCRQEISDALCSLAVGDVNMFADSMESSLHQVRDRIG